MNVSSTTQRIFKQYVKNNLIPSTFILTLIYTWHMSGSWCTPNRQESQLTLKRLSYLISRFVAQKRKKRCPVFVARRWQFASHNISATLKFQRLTRCSPRVKIITSFSKNGSCTSFVKRLQRENMFFCQLFKARGLQGHKSNVKGVTTCDQTCNNKLSSLERRQMIKRL